MLSNRCDQSIVLCFCPSIWIFNTRRDRTSLKISFIAMVIRDPQKSDSFRKPLETHLFKKKYLRKKSFKSCTAPCHFRVGQRRFREASLKFWSRLNRKMSRPLQIVSKGLLISLFPPPPESIFGVFQGQTKPSYVVLIQVAPRQQFPFGLAKNYFHFSSYAISGPVFIRPAEISNRSQLIVTTKASYEREVIKCDGSNRQISVENIQGRCSVLSLRHFCTCKCCLLVTCSEENLFGCL